MTEELSIPATPAEQLQTPITELAKSRKAIVDTRDELAILDIRIKETSLYKEMKTLQLELKDLLDADKANDDTVREIALVLYDGENKTLTDEVKITNTTDVEFIDDKKIIAWAAEHNQEALSYKKAAIKKVVKDGGMKVDGTKLVEGNAVRIASDLSGYLPLSVEDVFNQK